MKLTDLLEIANLEANYTKQIKIAKAEMNMKEAERLTTIKNSRLAESRKAQKKVKALFMCKDCSNSKTCKKAINSCTYKEDFVDIYKNTNLPAKI